jgi:glucose-1-phosphate adenylyltransferase
MANLTARYHEGEILAIIMGGGQGSRLFPLTKERSKPAVPLAGKYRLVDIPISNCINSNIRKIYLLTQFNSASLHRHISQSYKFDQFSDGFVEILAAEQTFSSSTWYQGTADAVRKNLLHFAPKQNRYFLVLSGDQLYRMDFRGIINQHVETNADLTVATIVKGQRDVSSLGIMQIDETRQVINFVEKPTDPEVQESLKLPKKWHSRFGIQGEDDCYLASMGIYGFTRGVLEELLTNNDSTDFGRHIIPEAIKTHRVFSYIFQGYWEDIGTIRSFFEANLAMTDELPPFDFFNMNAPIYSRPRFLPASKINGANVHYAAISDRCIINHAHLTQCVVGLRTVIERNANLKRVVLLGGDYYEPEESILESRAKGIPKIGIGENTIIENAIIDKGVRIGANCVIKPDGKPDKVDNPPMYYIRDGVVVIPKNAIIPDNTVI